jgi:TatA/E family protein of Tat protein translocase
MTHALLPIAWHPGMWELIVMLLIILVLFGSRLPKVARSLGQGITEFKKGIRGDGLTDPDATIEDKRRDDK